MVMVTYTSKCDSITNHSFIPLLWMQPVERAGCCQLTTLCISFRTVRQVNLTPLLLLTPHSASRLQSGAGNRFHLVPEVAAKQ